MKLLVSLHDVMPDTLDRTCTIFDRLCNAGLEPVTLLVVPGCGWNDSSLKQLRGLESRGAVLAGHGWRHEIETIHGPGHWLHSKLISRRAAEHLALSRRAVLRLMLDNHRWFVQHGFKPPGLYVPPAWAMGRVPRQFLDRLPFRFYETLRGVYCATNRRFLSLPLAGFEADTWMRATFIRRFNGLNRVLANLSQRPLRLGIHPFDLELKTAIDLAAWIEHGGQAMGYDQLQPVTSTGMNSGGRK